MSAAKAPSFEPQAFPKALECARTFEEEENVADDPADGVGALEMQLAGDVAVHELAAFLAVTEKVYFDALWVQRAEEAPEGVFPDAYSPSANEELWINRLEIGTSNFVELLGDPGALIEVAKYLGTFLATAVGAKIIVQYGDLKLKLAQANLTNARAEKLRAQGRISQEALQHKAAGVDIAQLAAMRAALTPQPPPVVRPASFRRVDTAIRAELKAIDRLDLLPILREHWRAVRAVRRGSQKESDIAAIRNAYLELKEALAPMSDDEVRMLLGRVIEREQGV
jgi:hypothetical protein